MARMISWSSVGWAATAIFSGINASDTVLSELECTIPLKRRLSHPPLHDSQVTLIEVILPGGNNFPTTVNPGDIPFGEFKDFPFRTIVLQKPEIIQEVALVASYAQASKSNVTPTQPVVVPGAEVTVKVHGGKFRVLELNVAWIWRIGFRLPEVGVSTECVVPLKLDGRSSDGWDTAVITLQLQLPNGRVLATEPVDPKDIPHADFRDFTIRSPELHEEIQLTVMAKTRGSLGSILLVGDAYFKGFYGQN